ncbi:hypothetical protein BVX99_02390 [bacterium F16]|nr:hypothetical protein BVX99_02390 [bacterium F16]
MNLRQYRSKLNKLIKDNPGCLDLPVITSADDEGNAFHVVMFAPSIGRSDGHTYTTPAPDANANAVCLN